MVIIGCDFHPGFQQIAMMDSATGELTERRLTHREEAERFYAALGGQEVLVGIEACGYTQWFEQMLEQMGHRFQIGDAAAIRASYVRWQKTDRRDAGHILRLLVEGRFPALWVPSAADRDVRQLVVHRHKRVQLRTRVKNQLHALALNQGLRLRWRPWRWHRTRRRGVRICSGSWRRWTGRLHGWISWWAKRLRHGRRRCG